MRHVPVLGGLLGVVALSPLVSGPDAPAARSADDPAAALRAAATGSGGEEDRRGARRQGRAAVRVAVYRGVRIPVPEGWEVHDLDRDPTRCVRYDRRAIYLGRQGERPDCPSRVIGGEDALHVEPLGPSRGHRTGAGTGTGAGPAAGSARSRTGAGTEARAARPAALARFTVAPTVDHRVRVPLREAGVVISGAYGRDPSEVQRVIRSATVDPAWSAGGDDEDKDKDDRDDRDDHDGRDDRDDRDDRDEYHHDHDYGPKHPKSKDQSSEGLPYVDPRIYSGGGGGGGQPTSTKPKPKSQPKSKAKPKPKAKPKKSGSTLKAWTVGKGFDTCTAPSLKAMRAWRRAYAVSNIYIGGAARGCAQPRLTRSWVKSVRAMGYRLIPTYVGLQAPCTKYRARFTARNAASEGGKAAVDAVRKAKNLGIPSGNPIYFDMEAYPNNNAGCRKAVLTFLHNWTKKLKAQGYVSGVYSSVGSGIRDLVRAKNITRPTAIWFAHWDGKARLYGHPSIPDSLWHPHRRIKQYRGGHRETHGGVTINVDSNQVDGRVY